MKKSVSGNVITFSFDGEAPVTFDVSAVTSPACIAYAPIHAYLAKIGDAAAIPREDKAGNIRTITEAMRREAVATMVEALMKPEALMFLWAVMLPRKLFLEMSAPARRMICRWLQT